VTGIRDVLLNTATIPTFVDGYQMGPDFILAKTPESLGPGPGGGGNSACIQMFNSCHRRASSFPNDSDANKALLECRSALRQCGALEQMPQYDGYLYVNGIGFVIFYQGKSYFFRTGRW